MSISLSLSLWQPEVFLNVFLNCNLQKNHHEFSLSLWQPEEAQLISLDGRPQGGNPSEGYLALDFAAELKIMKKGQNFPNNEYSSSKIQV